MTPNAIALAERGERGISEPLARLVKMLVQIHTGELVSEPQVKQAEEADETTRSWHGLSARLNLVGSVPLAWVTVSGDFRLNHSHGCREAAAQAYG